MSDCKQHSWGAYGDCMLCDEDIYSYSSRLEQELEASFDETAKAKRETEEAEKRHHKDICEFEALRNTPSPRDVVLKAAEVLCYGNGYHDGNTFKTPNYSEFIEYAETLDK